MDDAYSGGLCGITKEEAWNDLQPEMSAMAQKMGVSSVKLFEKLMQKYDGYHFSPKSEDIFNPFSLFCSLSKQELGDYWFSSGTPTSGKVRPYTLGYPNREVRD